MPDLPNPILMRGVDPATVITRKIVGDVEYDAPLQIPSGETWLFTGNVRVGTTVAPLDMDATLLEIEDGGRMVVEGDLVVARVNGASTNLIGMGYGSQLTVSGDINAEDGTAGDVNSLDMKPGAQLDCRETLSITTDCTGGSLSSAIYAVGAKIGVGDDLEIVASGVTTYPIWLDQSDVEVQSDLLLTADNQNSFGYPILTMRRNARMTVFDSATLAGASAVGPVLGISTGAQFCCHNDMVFNFPAATGHILQITMQGQFSHTRGSGTISVTTGADTVVWVDNGAVDIHGTLDVLAHGAGGSQIGSVIYCRAGTVNLEGMKFDGGSDLDVGQTASIFMDDGSRFVCDGDEGDYDALNSHAVNPGVLTAFGVEVRRGSQAHMPEFETNTGIGATGAAANGKDMKCGGSNPADYAAAPGAEVLTDIGAGAPELCTISKENN